MGEKEQGMASIEDEGAGAPGDATGRASNLNLSKSNIDRITGDPDFDTARASSVQSSKSNTSDREMGTVLSPDVDLVDTPAAQPGIVKSKSNITNNREGAPGGSAGDGIVIDEPGAH